MANDYFDSVPVAIAAGTRARASQVNAVSAAVEAGFDLLPTEDEIKLGLTRYAVDSGVADAYVLTMPYTPILTDGFNFIWKAVNANTGPATININATGIKSIVNPDGSALIAGTFGANAIIICAYESIGDRYILVSQNPAQAALAQSSAIASAASAAAALVSEGNAATSETNAAASETAAGISETNAAASDTAAGISETNAAASEASTASLYDQFDDRYLGDKAADPTLDNDGAALLTGALYFNTISNIMRVYNGVAWQDVPATNSVGGAGAIQFGTVGGGFDGSTDFTYDGTTVTTLGTHYIENASILEAVNIYQSGSGQAGYIYSDFNRATPMWTFEQDNVLAAGAVVQILNNGTGNALDVGGDIAVSGTVDGIDLQLLNTAVGLNTAKVTNATHTGQVTGATALSLAVSAITAQPASGAIVDADTFLINDGGVLSEATAAQLKTYIGGGVGGSDTQVQYNNAGALGGMAGVTWASGGSTLTFGSAAEIIMENTGDAMIFNNLCNLRFGEDISKHCQIEYSELQGLGSAGALIFDFGSVGGEILISDNGFQRGALPKGGGYRFTANSLLSTDTKTLDDYEEGTWTPTIQDSTESDAEGQTYTVQEGTYTKIGRVVYVTAYLAITSIGTLTGTQQARINGLPFTSIAGRGGAASFGFCAGLNITAGQVVSGVFTNNDTKVSMQIWDATTGTSAMTVTQVSAGSQLYFSGFYFTAG